MRDADIRALLVATALQQHADEPDTLVRHELGICAGRRRVDIAVVNGELSGWEIKSDVDTLRRLDGQASAYSAVLDRATLVTTRRWESHAVEVVPTWWGITVAEEQNFQIVLRVVREAQLNQSGVDPFALSQLLWRDEALAELRSRGLAAGLSSKARHYVWARLADSFALDELRSVVRNALRARQSW